MESAGLNPEVIAGLGMVVTMLASSLVMMAKMLTQTKAVNQAVNNRPEGEGLFSKLGAIQTDLGHLLDADRAYQAKGWASLPEDINTAAKLTQTVRNLQIQDKAQAAKLEELLATLKDHDAWERAKKEHSR